MLQHIVNRTPNLNEYATAEHALKYLARADRIPHRTEGEAVLLEFVPQNVGRILDLGTGDGRLLALLRINRRGTQGVALDFSPTMLNVARERFRGDPKIQVPRILISSLQRACSMKSETKALHKAISRARAFRR